MPEFDLAAVQAVARATLVGYCILMDPSYDPAPHTKKIIALLEAIEKGEVRRAMIFMPPRHGKSYHVSERFPAWFLGRNPQKRVILASYAATLAETNSRTVRGLLEDERNPFPTRIAADTRAVGRWETTAGGSLLAAGVGGGITGFGADVLDIDDPFAGRAEADSDLQRANVWAWYQEVARTRLMRGGRILVCNTRWHEDDLAGRLLNSKGASDWTVLSLPAIAEEDDILGRKVGEALWPAQFPASELPSVEKGEMDSRGFAALYQQRPVPREGSFFKAQWFERRYEPWQLEQLEQGPRWRVVQAVDTATKEGVSTDFSVIATWATDGISYYLLDIVRRRVDYPTLKALVERLYWQHKPRQVYVEDTTHGRPLVQEMRYTSPIPLVAKTVKGSKEARASVVTALFESGKVVLPKEAPWLDEWIAEHLSFPMGAHDDQVDTTSLALTELSEPGLELPRYGLSGRPLSRSAV